MASTGSFHWKNGPVRPRIWDTRQLRREARHFALLESTARSPGDALRHVAPIPFHPGEPTVKKIRPKTPLIDIGIGAGEREKIALGLSGLLADSYTLYLMTHNFHWNVKGPMFNTLHIMFMDQYTEQWTALDLIAERIRALGHAAPGTYRQFIKRASIKEIEGVPAASDMIRHLVAAQEATARTARGLFPLVNAANDQPSADLLTQRLEVHEKTAWMLRSLLED
jgi:starvation-inducible DNA-binding protein